MNSPTFQHLFDNSTTIPYKKEWRSLNNRLRNAITGKFAFKLESGDIASAVDDDGSIILLLGTTDGTNVVIYERFITYANPRREIVSDETVEFANLVEITTNVNLTGVLDEIKILAICETVSRSLTNTRSDWGDRARTLHPWSVV